MAEKNTIYISSLLATGVLIIASIVASRFAAPPKDSTQLSQLGVSEDQPIARGGHGGGHHGSHHHSHHGHHEHRHHGDHHGHRWNHDHGNWWHHNNHPNWNHEGWHNGWHNDYWYGGGAYFGGNPGYYYDPNYYYQVEGTPSVEYEYDYTQPSNTTIQVEQPATSGQN